MSLLIQLKVKNLIFFKQKNEFEKYDFYWIFIGVHGKLLFFFLFSYKSKFKSSTLQVLQESCFGALT